MYYTNIDQYGFVSTSACGLNLTSDSLFSGVTTPVEPCGESTAEGSSVLPVRTIHIFLAPPSTKGRKFETNRASHSQMRATTTQAMNS